MSKSFFLYIHQSLCGTPGIYKIGKTMTPYSAVRSRQKFMAKTFSLDYLYFGAPDDVARLESLLKHKLKLRKVEGAARTELFRVDLPFLLLTINNIIENRCLAIKPVQLDSPYSASNSGDCPLGIPSELSSYFFLRQKIWDIYGTGKMFDKEAHFNQLFEVCSEK